MKLFGITICMLLVLSPVWSDLVAMDYKARTPPSGEKAVQRARRQTNVRDCPTPTPNPNTVVNTTLQLNTIREYMEQFDFDAYIVPSEDAHGSEYIAEPDKRRQYVSGFSGSAGLAIVTQDYAALWTDGRYFLQAEMELSCDWDLMKSAQTGVPEPDEWLVSTSTDRMQGANLPDGSRVGFDPTLLSISSVQNYMNTFTESGRNIIMVSNVTNLVDLTWVELAGSKPTYPGEKLIVLNISYSGQTWQDKIINIRGLMQNNNADKLIVTKLDEIAWLFNLRGEDIPYNPMFISYAVVGAADITLYVYDSANRLAPDNVRTHLDLDGCAGAGPVCITEKSYSEFDVDLPNLPTSSQIWFSDVSSYFIFQSVPTNVAFIEASPILLIKSQKNPTEVEGMKEAHRLDSISLCELGAWLQDTFDNLDDPVNGDIDVLSEIIVQDQSLAYRRRHPSFQGLSFGTISSFGPNGAIIHYSTSEATNVPITSEGVYLLDSGGQYLEGTTDITRTFHFGEPTAFQKEAYTRVLMGHINLVLATFRTGVYGFNIDAAARGPLWEGGLDYLHGTGHGIGHFLNVHEGPANIGLGYSSRAEPIYLDMFFSDEPGYYEDGQFGMRIEDIMYVVEADTPRKFNDYTYMTFEMISLVPLEPKLIDFTLMTKRQIEWYNAYNEKIKTTIRPDLTPEGQAWVDSKIGFVNPNSAARIVTSMFFVIATSLFAILMH